MEPPPPLLSVADSSSEVLTELRALKPLIFAGLATSGVACLLLLVFAIAVLRRKLLNNSDALDASFGARQLSSISTPSRAPGPRTLQADMAQSSSSRRHPSARQSFGISPYPPDMSSDFNTTGPTHPLSEKNRSVGPSVIDVPEPEFSDRSSIIAVVSETQRNLDVEAPDNLDTRSMEAQMSTRSSLEYRMAEKLEKYLRPCLPRQDTTGPSTSAMV